MRGHLKLRLTQSMFKTRFLLMMLLCVIAIATVVQSQQDSPLYALPSANTPVYTSNSLALSSNGRTVVAANMFNNSVSLVSITTSELLAEIPVGVDPRSIALTPDNSRALVVNRGSGTLSVIDMTTQEVTASYVLGLLPYAVIAPTDDSAFVSVEGEDTVIELDLDTGDTLQRIVTPDAPTGLTMWGDFLYVTHLWSGDVSLIYLPQEQVVRTVATGQDTGLSQHLSIDRSRGLAYLPQTRLNAGNRALTYDSIVFPVINVLDLDNLGVRHESRLNLDVLDRPVNMPFASAMDSVRNWVFVANAGSDDISVIELNTGETLAHINVGENPRGLVLSLNGGLLYVHNMVDGTITTIETRNFTVSDVLPISNPSIPVDVLIGAELFHTSRDRRLDTNNWLSCATCHFDGQSDGRVWAGFPDGASNTPVLYDLPNTAPYTWAGTWDEVADVELKIRNLQAGFGLINGDINAPMGDFHAGLSIDLDSLTTYLLTLTGATTSPSSASPEIIAQGEAIFTELDCASCHAGDSFTDGMIHDVGTDGEFNTPSLRWLWQSAPYLHDGRAQTLRGLFTLSGAHQLIGQVADNEIDALIAYLLSLPSGE